MTAPQLVNFKTFDRPETMKQVGLDRWVPARDYRLPELALMRRLRLAWGVFTGRYDAFDWEQD